MKRTALGILALTALIVVACGGGSSEPPSEAQETFDVALATAEGADIADPVRSYASQMCDPLRAMFEELSENAHLFADANTTDEEDLGSFMVLMGALEEPLTRFAEELEEIKPPEELEDYHRDTLASMLFAVETMKVISEGGLFAAIALGEGPPEPPDPAGWDDAIVLECGEDLLELMDSEDFGDLFDDENGGSDPTVEPSESFGTVAAGESFTVDAAVLGELFGEGELTGTITVTVREPEIASAIESDFGGPQVPRGKFVVVTYEVTSNLNRRMQPSTQINDDLVLTDARDREWLDADYSGDYFGISGDAAGARGCDGPSTWLGAGFSGCTAVVFDVPLDAGEFSLVWGAAEVAIDLGQ